MQICMHPSGIVGDYQGSDIAKRAQSVAKHRLTVEQQQLAMENMGLAFKASIHHRGKWLSPDEAEGEALYTLVRAVKGYKKIVNGKSIRFSTYFFKCWQNHLIRAYEIATRSRRGHQAKTVSLEASGQIHEPRTNPDMLAQELDRAEKAKELHAALGKLVPREKQVLLWRMEGFTLQQIGKEFGVTRERARQIEAKALFHIRKIYEGINSSMPRQEWSKKPR